MKEKLTNYAHRLEGQPMFRLLDKVKQLESQGKSIIHFEIGDPDFHTPAIAIETCIKALNEGQTHYVSSSGLQELKVAVVDHTLRDLKFKPDISQIVISPGANALVYFIIQCLVKPDEEVIVPTPAFSTYYSVLKLLNLKAACVPLKEENNFRMDPDDIASRITPKTKLIIINSPQNPTGSVMTEEEISAVYSIAKKHNLFILSDEIYRLMSYDCIPASPSVFDQCRERTIIMTGFSKSFAMTGWRLGYMIGPSDLGEKVSLLIQTIISCVPPFIQKSGIPLLQEVPTEAREMMKEFKICRDIIVEGLNRLPGVSCVKPEGAFYAFPNIHATGMTSDEFANVMLEEAGVALLPGTSFGDDSERYVRLCYATSISNIRLGLDRMRAILEKRLQRTIKV